MAGSVGSSSANFGCSPAVDNARSFSYDWPSRYGPASDGSCDENVAVMVLDSFGIPIKGSHPNRGNLCMCDINNMPAIEAINFSLLENLADQQLLECYMDNDGFAFFQEVYPNPPSLNLDVRLCIPTSTVEQKVDLVIVRGYDTPPVRDFKDWEELQWVGTAHSLSDYFGGNCAHFTTEAWRVYKDPILETSYKDGLENLYDLQAFESLVGYAIQFKGSDNPDVKYSFNNSSIENISIGGRGNGLTLHGNGVAGCLEATGETNIVIYDGFSFPLRSFMSTDRYGEPYQTFISVQSVFCKGYSIKGYTNAPVSVQTESMPGAWSLGGQTTWLSVDPLPKNIQIPAGNWHVSYTNGVPIINVYYTYAADDPSGGYQQLIDLFLTGQVKIYPEGSTQQVYGEVWPFIGGSYGLVVVGDFFATVEVDRPCVNVISPNGDAKALANALYVAYQPIVVTDVPASVAYTFGNGARLIDHTLDLYDTDPCTVQVPPSLVEGSLSWLQTQTSGSTLDISLPFADDNDCLALANTIFAIQSEEITSYNLVCGPDDEPLLGAKVNGYEGRINKITYSFQDGQSYNINVNIGSTFMGLRGGNGGLWYRKQENVSRDGVVLWSAGDGINFRVKVQGLGVFNAINMCLDVHAVGDKVKCTVNNLSQER